MMRQQAQLMRPASISIVKVTEDIAEALSRSLARDKMEMMSDKRAGLPRDVRNAVERVLRHGAPWLVDWHLELNLGPLGNENVLVNQAAGEASAAWVAWTNSSRQLRKALRRWSGLG